MRPMLDMKTAGEQRRPRTKIAKHKGPNTNDVTDKNDKENEGRKKQPKKTTKNVNINLPYYVTI